MCFLRPVNATAMQERKKVSEPLPKQDVPPLAVMEEEPRRPVSLHTSQGNNDRNPPQRFHSETPT